MIIVRELHGIFWIKLQQGECIVIEHELGRTLDAVSTDDSTVEVQELKIRPIKEDE